MTQSDRRAPTPDRDRKVTLADVARGCGVSRATASLVLRGSPLVHVETRRRVENEMRRQGYVYNRAAANLRRSTSNVVALVINDLTDHLSFKLATDIIELLRAEGYVTLLGNSAESLEQQSQVLQMFMEHQPAGIILSPVKGSVVDDIALTVGRYAPLMVLNGELVAEESAGFECELFEPYEGAAGAAAEHLLKLMCDHNAALGSGQYGGA